MKYHGARDGYDPAKIDKARRAEKVDEAIFPFKFRPIPLEHSVTRTSEQKAFKKRPLHKKRKHGRPA